MSAVAGASLVQIALDLPPSPVYSDGTFPNNVSRRDRDVPERIANVTDEPTRGRSPWPQGLPPREDSIESDLDLLLTHSTDAFVVYDPEFRYTFINRAGASLLGCSPEEVIGRTNLEILGPGADTIEPHVRRVFEEGDKVFVVHEIPLPAGPSIFDTVYSPVRDNRGAVCRVVGICRDVSTDRARIQRLEDLVGKRTKDLAAANEELRQQASLFRGILEKGADGICIYHTLSEFPFVRFTHWNPMMTEITGYTREELNKKGWYQMLFPDPEVRERAREYTEGILTQENIRAESWTITMRDGTERVISVSNSVLREENGTIHVLAVIRDITERERSRETLRETKERYRELADSITDLFFAMDRDLRITYWNPTAESMTGIPALKALGKTLCDLLPVIRNTELESLFRNTLASRIPGTLLSALPVENEERDFDVHAYPSRRGLSVFARDVTRRVREELERKRLEAELQKTRRTEAITTLAGGMAHQLNNALSAVMGNLELMRLDLMGLDASTRHTMASYAEPIQESLERMAELTRQVLAYAQGGRYSPTLISLSTFLRYTLPLLSHAAPPSIRLESDLAPDLASVEADTTQLQMVLSAILQNASEAMEGSGTIRVSAQNIELADDAPERPSHLKAGPFVRLVVEDDGVGMDEEILSRIFDPFFSTKFQGRGLAMAAAYGIVKNHGGWISVASEPGRGTTVAVWLPARKIPREKPKASPAPARMEATGTVMVVEDEQPVLAVFRTVLQRMGLRVLDAPTGEEALRLARTPEERIDLVILDILLPDIDGRSVYPEIMKVWPGIPVIVTSGYSLEGPAQEILDAGAQAFLQKPFSLEELREKVRYVLGDEPSS